MGYPELPPDGDEKDFPDVVQIGVNFHPATSEDSDTNEPNPVDSPYSGYEQLTFDGQTFIAATAAEDPESEDDDDTSQPSPVILPTYPSDFAEIECSGGGNSFPDVIPVDIELAQEVWSAPPEPGRSNTIELDDTRTNQIITLMSGISLPQNCIPEWAQNLSEDKWKQELLDKIRKGTENKNNPSDNNK